MAVNAFHRIQMGLVYVIVIYTHISLMDNVKPDTRSNILIVNVPGARRLGSMRSQTQI